MTNTKYDIELQDDVARWGLTLANGVQDIDEFPQTASSLLINPGGGRFRRGDPTFSEYEQETFNGGRGGDLYTDDQSRFFDSKDVVTRFGGKLFLASLWKFSDGLRSQDKHMPGAVIWKQLISTERYISVAFVASASYSADSAYIKLRRRGSPGTLTLELRSDSGGSPNAVLKTVTKTVSDIVDVVSLFQLFDWTTTEALTSGTTYHLVVYGASTDNPVNHWEVGVDDTTTGSKYSTAGSSWAAATYKLYFRVTDADTDVKWHLFNLGSSLYAVSQPPSGNSVIKLWNETDDDWDAVTPGGTAIAGTVKSVAVSNSLAFFAYGTASGDTTIGQWNGTDHRVDGATGTGGTNNVKADLIIAGVHPTAGAQLFYARNNAAAGDTYCVKRAGVPAAYATDLAIGDTWSLHKGEDIIGLASHSDNAVYVRTVSRLYGIQYDAYRNDELIVDKNPKLALLRETATFQPMLSDGAFLYYPFSYSLERMSGQTHDDIGMWRGVGMPDGRQGIISALCSGISGMYVGIDCSTTGTSSVYWTDGMTWHEVWRAYKSGVRVRNVFYQAQNGSTSPARLWINCGNDLIYIDQPDNSLIPLNDTDTRYVDEGHIISTTHDFGTYQLSKLFDQLDVIANNLDRLVSIAVDVQTDSNVGTSTWDEIDVLYTSPVDVAVLNLGNKKKMRYRLRLMTSDHDTTPEIKATVLSGAARTITKRQWNLNVKSSDYQLLWTGAKDHGTMTLYNWLLQASQQMKTVTMKSNMLNMDNIKVIVEQPRFYPVSYNKTDKKHSAVFSITLREAAKRDSLQY